MKENKRSILKRTAAAVLCATFLLPAALPAAAYAGEISAGVQTEAEKTLAQIRLSVGDGQETPVFRAGDKAKLQISVKNTGNTDAQNVRIEPVIKSETEWPFELDQLNYERELGTVAAGRQTSADYGEAGTPPLKVKDSVTGKAYKLAFCITYDDGETAYETEKICFRKNRKRELMRQEKSRPRDAGEDRQAGMPRVRREQVYAALDWARNRELCITVNRWYQGERDPVLVQCPGLLLQDSPPSRAKCVREVILSWSCI